MIMLESREVGTSGRDQYECSSLSAVFKDKSYHQTIEQHGISIAYECNDGAVSNKIFEYWGE